MKQTNILIIGSGVAGLSTAHHLNPPENRKAPVVVLEKEPDLGPHASSKNSGMIHHFHPVQTMRQNIASGVHRLRAFDDESKNSFLTDCESLFLFPEDKAESLNQDPKPWGGRHERDPSSVPASLKPSNVPSGASWQAFEKDGLIDSDRLLEALQRELSRKGIPVRFQEKVQDVSRNSSSWRIDTENSTYRANYVVNAAGAWAEQVGSLFGAESKQLVPYARYLFVADENLLPPETGFYWDAVHNIYFRHYENRTLLSVCDNHRVPPGTPPDVEDPPSMLKRELQKHYPQFADITVADYWFCHRTRAPDRIPFISEDPDRNKLYWVAGLEGHGITASMWVGQQAASMIPPSSTQT